MSFSTFVLLPLFVLAALFACRKLDLRERRIAMISFGIHVLLSVGQWSINEFYYDLPGDAAGYQLWGEQISRVIETDVIRYVPEVLKYALHFENRLPFEAPGDGNSTGTMCALTGLIITGVGPSILTLYFVATSWSWFGQLCIYLTAKEELERRDHSPAMIAIMLIPSAIVWGAVYSKEALVMGFLGILIRSTWSLLRRRRLPSAVGIIVSGVGIGVLKPYTLFALVLALPTFIYADRVWRGATAIRIRPVYLVLAAALSLGGVAAMGKIFPQFATDKLAETLAQNQSTWQTGERNGQAGGSYIEVGSAEATTASQQVVYAPLAFVNAFFRPFIFEARGAPAVAAAIESTVLTVLVLQLFGARTRRIIPDAVLRTPLLVFSIVFCLSFGVVVGLASSNLGSLSRYRMPMMPFYALIVLILRARGRRSSARPLRPALMKVRRQPTPA